MDEQAPSPSHTPRPHRSIEDNYPEYLDQAFGYAYEVADVMTQAEIARHEGIVHASADELDALDPSALDDFDRWALARAWRRLGEVERYLDTARLLLASEAEHPVIIYSEISRGVALDLADAGRLDEALEQLRVHLQRWDSDIQARELKGIIEFVATGDDATALEELVAEFPDDAELRLDIAEDLWRFGGIEAARTWVHNARSAAVASDDRAALVDIELLETRIERTATAAD